MVKKLNIPNAYINILREVHCMNAYLVRVNAKCYLYCIQVPTFEEYLVFAC